MAGLPFNSLRGRIADFDPFIGPPDDNRWEKYFLGLVAPLGLLGYDAFVSYRGASYAWAAFLACLALFFHVHHYWSQSPRLQRSVELGKEVLAAALIGLVGYGVYHFIMLS